jgi:hypothetical protein
MMSEMMDRCRLAVVRVIQDSDIPIGTHVDSEKIVRAVFEAMRDYRGEVEEALDRVPGGWGRGAWIEGIDAALGQRSAEVKEAWEKELDKHDGNSRDERLKELVDQWKSEAANLRNENAEAARIYARCADQLALLAYRIG